MSARIGLKAAGYLIGQVQGLTGEDLDKFYYRVRHLHGLGWPEGISSRKGRRAFIDQDQFLSLIHI